MGLLDEVFPKKEPSRHRAFKNTPTKKAPDKSTRSTTAEKSTSSQTNGNSSIFSSLKRVQGALSPALKKKSASKQDAKTNNVEDDVVDKDKGEHKSKGKEKEPDKERKLWFRSSSRANLRKESIKSSATSLGHQKTALGDTKKKRPATVFSDTNITFRRGQNTKIDGQNLGENNLSRTSSVTNLDAEPRSGKGARPRKSSSRDKIDKIGESKKNDKKGITRNNNKLDSGENPYPSVDSLPEEELSHLRKQLQEMAQEKSNLALQLGEQKGQLSILQKEIQKLKEESNIQLEHLTEENTALRNRLRDVAHSPLSDNEKQQLLFDSHRHHSSAPASIATNIIEDGNGGDTTCTTPDWDKHSSSNVSEVSVACLQDKINQMQETHYSTNEELQATLQELTDLQRQLTELQQENERLNEEKTLMFDSLCRQTERLNDSRSEVESLKQLLYQDKDDTGQFETAVEREQKLVELLKSSQEERESLLLKIEQLNNELQEFRVGIKEKEEQISQLRDRVRTLECTLDAKHAEHKLLDQELAQAKDQCSGKQIEINRLTDLLDNARTKINELEQDRALSDKSELDELLDNARKEKDTLESEVAHLKEQLAISKNEIEKLKEQVSILQEECKVTRNNAKTTQSDLEYKCEKLVKEKNILNDKLQEFQEALNELEVQSQCQLEDKRQLSAVLSETQRNLSETEQKNAMLENEVQELKKQRAEENEEWEKFQDDLLTSVRVANDFKTEAQQDLQRMILENKQFRERERQLKAEIEKLKGGTIKSSNKENQEMDTFIKRPNRRNRNRATATDKVPQTIPVKRRENKLLKSKRLKTLSVEEELLLASLNSYHAGIDITIPDENLTEEQKIIRKLKIIYEDDYLKIKPVAPKAKDQLAISKPLLDSVLTNPKLMEIIKNPKVKTIEDMASFEKEAPEIRNVIREIDRSAKGKSDTLTSPANKKRVSLIGRSMSVDQVHHVDLIETNIKLYRTVETEDLTGASSLNIGGQRVSSLVPSDSVSNCNKRYSDFTVVVNSQSDNNIFNQNVKYSTLEKIVKSIPKNTPESMLNKEQQFAVRLLNALEERKNTLKKSSKAKTLPISKPTEESVLRNKKLKEIIYDPDIKDIVRRKSDVQRQQTKDLTSKLKASKSYNDITFSFDDKLHVVNMYNSGSDSSLSSAEFNIETNEVGPYDEKSFTNTLRKALPIPNISKSTELTTFSNKKSLEDPLPEKVRLVDSLIYNETLKKNKHLKVDLHKIDNHKPSKVILYAQEELVPTQDPPVSQQPILHFATIETIPVSKADEHDSLNYNDTLERAKLRGPYKTSPAEVNDTISNITEKFNQLQKLINEDKEQLEMIKNEKPTDYIKDGTDEYDYHQILKEDKAGVTFSTTRRTKPFSDTLATDESGAYDYHQIFKENRTGVPLTMSSNTEPVGDEYHQIFKETIPLSITSITEPVDDDLATDDSADGSGAYDYHQILKENRAGVASPLNHRLSYRGVVTEIKKRFSTNEYLEEEPNPDSYVEVRNKNIDKEMEHIFEHYLKTRVSQVIKQTEDKPDNSSTPIKKKNTETGLDKSKLSPKELTFSDDSYFELKNGQVTNVKAFEKEETTIKKSNNEDSGVPVRMVCDNSDLQIIRTLNESSIEQFEDIPLECKEIHRVEIVENRKSPIVQFIELGFTTESLNVEQQLTQEDLAVIQNVKSHSYSRPLSEINDDDIKLIQSLSANYLTDRESVDVQPIESCMEQKGLLRVPKQSISSADCHQELDKKVEEIVKSEENLPVVDTQPKEIYVEEKELIKVRKHSRSASHFHQEPKSDEQVEQSVRSEENLPLVDVQPRGIGVKEKELITAPTHSSSVFQLHQGPKSFEQVEQSVRSEENLPLVDVQPRGIGVKEKELITAPTHSSSVSQLHQEPKSFEQEEENVPLVDVQPREMSVEEKELVAVPKYSTLASDSHQEPKLDVEIEQTVRTEENIPSVDKKPREIFVSGLNKEDVITKGSELKTLEAKTSKINDQNNVLLNPDEVDGKIVSNVPKINKPDILNTQSVKGEEPSGRLFSEKDVCSIPDVLEDHISLINNDEENVKVYKQQSIPPLPIISPPASNINDNKIVLTKKTDDLEELLGKMSSTRNRVVKKKIVKSETKQDSALKNFTSEEDPGKNINKPDVGTTFLSLDLSPTLNEAGTIDRKTERHVILYRNKKPQNREVKSLNLEAVVAAPWEKTNRWSGLADLKSAKPEKKVKSFAQHFELLSQHRTKHSDPIYANVRYLSRSKQQQKLSPLLKTTEKKPLPIPRAKNQVVSQNDSSDDGYSDANNIGMEKMTERSKNLSDETGRENVVEEISSTLVNIPKLDGLPSDIEKPKQIPQEVPEIKSHISDLTGTSNVSEGDENQSVEPKLTSIQKSEKFSDKIYLLPNAQSGQEQLDEVDGAASSYSVIAVANTTEKLDLRTPSEVVVDSTDNKIDDSNLNLVNLENLETPSFDKGYVGVFNANPADKTLSESDQQKMTYNITYLGEVSDTEIYDDPKVPSEDQTNSKPKIVDFVPLDDATKPFFANNNNMPEYGTLEREKAYHVLQSASVSNIAKVEETAKEPTKEETQGSKIDLNVTQTKSLINIETTPKVKLLPSTNSTKEHGEQKTSYSVAKKVFQELEAKQSVKVDSKDIIESEPPKSTIKVSVSGKSEISAESKSVVSDNRDGELTKEEIEKEI